MDQCTALDSDHPTWKEMISQFPIVSEILKCDRDFLVKDIQLFAKPERKNHKDIDQKK